jgi:hypothetical protein
MLAVIEVLEECSIIDKLYHKIIVFLVRQCLVKFDEIWEKQSD